jgi:hypothetical protein
MEPGPDPGELEESRATHKSPAGPLRLYPSVRGTRSTAGASPNLKIWRHNKACHARVNEYPSPPDLADTTSPSP